jgi:primosomal protein N' (replication factor Y)
MPPPDDDAAPRFADVALPLPLPDPLTYSLPAGLASLAALGVRVRVRVGKRRLKGVVVALNRERPGHLPAEAEIRPIEAVLDRRPVAPPDLMELARFMSSYYLASLGEVLRSVLPADLPPWGERRFRLTDAGALGSPRNPEEDAIVEALRAGDWMSVSNLQERLGLEEIDRPLEGLVAAGRITGDEGRRQKAARYVNGFALVPGEKEALQTAAGRSAAGREVVEYLYAVERPATQAELAATVGASPAVLRRLVKIGVLRTFTQVERLELGRHMLAPEATADFELRADQQEALDRLSQAVIGREFAPMLLQGMTGSGKTEVYLRAAEVAIAQGRSVILLVPEIALVPALARAVEQRFGDRMAILHSGLGAAERLQEWERIRNGEARVVLGPRSALFAPVGDLGLLVVDEEQDPAYKQEVTPRYHARDLALVRGKAAAAVTLLVSATPSFESRWNADPERGKLARLPLTARAGKGGLPEGILVDLRDEAAKPRPGEVTFSVRLREEIALALAAGDQVILLRNRRGYSPRLLCRACGEDIRCESCGLPRTYHRRARRLVCHYCGSTLPAPENCPACGRPELDPIGDGTERVEERFSELFPGTSVDVLDRDTARRPGGPAALLERFGRGDIQVLIGTQMVSKGHHFPRVALAGVLSADAYLSFPDFRAVERTYNLLTQLAGRAGRGDRPGKVVIQTYHPDHYAIRAALSGDDEGFARDELRYRRSFHYPPFTRMVQLLVTDKNRERAESQIATLHTQIKSHRLARSVRITGPAPAPFERLRGEWRFQLLLRSADRDALHQLLREVLPRNPPFDLTVDVDPQQLL